MWSDCHLLETFVVRFEWVLHHRIHLEALLVELSEMSVDVGDVARIEMVEGIPGRTVQQEVV